MPVNYFNEDPKSNSDIDKVIKKIEYRLTSNIDRLKNAQLHHDMGAVSQVQGGDKKLAFPVDLVALKPMKIVAASVVMKFTDDSNADTKREKSLKIYTKTPDQEGYIVYPLTPNDSRAVSVSCSHVLQPGHRYNAGLKFMLPSHARLLRVALVKLYYELP